MGRDIFRRKHVKAAAVRRMHGDRGEIHKTVTEGMVARNRQVRAFTANDFESGTLWGARASASYRKGSSPPMN